MAGFFCERNLWSDDWSEGGDWSEQYMHPVYMAFSLVHSPCEIWVRVTKKAHFWWFHGSWRRPGLTELRLERLLPTVFYIGKHSNTGDLVNFYKKSANTAFTTHEGRALGDLADVRLPFPPQSFLGRSLIARFCDKIKSYSLQESS